MKLELQECRARSPERAEMCRGCSENSPCTYVEETDNPDKSGPTKIAL